MRQLTSIKIFIVSAFTLALLLGCKSTPSTVDYDTDTNFGQFSFYQLTDTTKDTSAPSDEITSERIKEAIITQLSGKSLSLVEKDGDLQVNYFTTLEQREKKSSFSIGIGGSNRSSNSATGVGLGTTIPLDSDFNTYIQITIDMHHQGKLVWRGFDGFEAEQDISPEDKQKGINEVVAKVLANYPPKK
ncbi:DUF4136 domain-containing protein [Thalassotalea psychrophila]|uniref:DUF4136 domain-containing protein n=1 Tax=Thalassotalea psychrophila TaxID=3065647 RepID=A0ABY9U043_9GAMM|nr:DUF4136 domain-containing protein [Colwelliaceae bacterium SQ149]